MYHCRFCGNEVPEPQSAGNHWCTEEPKPDSVLALFGKRKGTWKGLLDEFSHNETCTSCRGTRYGEPPILMVVRRSLPGNRDAYYCADCYGKNRKAKHTTVSPFIVFVTACMKR